MTRKLINQALEAMLSVRVVCNDLNHKRGDQHQDDETCKPLERWNAAIEALLKHREDKNG